MKSAQEKGHFQMSATGRLLPFVTGRYRLNVRRQEPLRPTLPHILLARRTYRTCELQEGILPSWALPAHGADLRRT